MEKWNLPPEPIPFWLDPSREIKDELPKLRKELFAVRCVNVLLALNLNLNQAVEIAANSVVETGWGQHFKAWNLGGWKINKNSHLNSDGTQRFWWRAPGNKNSGDPPWCYYRAFSSMEDFFREWLKKYVPNPPVGRYAATSEAFWGKGAWFAELIKAGYKGEVTKATPGPSLKAHAELCRKILVMWVQSRLGLKIDGDVGLKTTQALLDYQKNKVITPTGRIDSVTLQALCADDQFEAVAS